MRIATPSLQRTSTAYSLPVSTGAPKVLIFASNGLSLEEASTAQGQLAITEEHDTLAY
jgi:hypothetical protein